MRFGLIGCGGIGALRAAALARGTAGTLVSVADLDAERSRTLAAKTGADAHTEWRALVERRDVEAVIVSTPPHLHAEMCVAALEAGKHVLCEKPLARTPDECRAVVAAADRAGRFLATGFNYRFYPSIEKARLLLDSGAIGALDHIRSYTGYSAQEHSQPWLHDPGVMGGGALRDNGIHLIDLTRYFLGDVAEVRGFGTSCVWAFPGCEDNGFALLRSAGGHVATLQASWTEWRGYRLRIEIYGMLGCIRTSCFPMLTEIVSAPSRGGRMKRRVSPFLKTFVGEHLRSYRWVVVQSFISELDAFVRATRAEPSRVATGLDGLRAVEVAHAAATGMCTRLE
jgi:predicted dehydrogenase